MLSTGQHTLTTQPDADDSLKYCILVKLTDSSAKAIEEYLKNKDNTAKKPSIMFHKEKGEICFPIESNPKQNNASGINNSSNDVSLFRHKKFMFSLSSVKESNKDTSASFECISYADSKLKTMGSIENKLSVNAINDEVFQATKEKVTSVAEAEKNNSTIEIKPSGAIVSRSGSAASNFNVQNNIRNKQNNLSQNTTPKLNTSASSVPEIVKPKSLVTDKSLKERVIHILAIKPYKKPEIFLKLNKESPLSEKEKEILESTLQSVATINPKNNQFDLLNDVMLNEVKEDWPAYNQNDKQIIKRNITKAKQSIGNTSLNNSLNTSSNVTRPSLSANMNKPSLSPVVQSKNVSPTKSENTTKMPFYNGNNSFSNLKSKYPSQSPSGEIENHDSSNKKAMDPNFDLQLNNSKRLKPTTNGVNTVKLVDNATKFINEFMKKYKPIETSSQFNEYKKDFEDNYKEYKDLYQYLMPISKKFENYRLEMESLTDHSSKEYIEKKKKIFQDFQSKNSDTDYCKKRDRYEYLDSKLNFLNDLFEKCSNSTAIGF